MRIKAEIKTSGYFWLPANPENKVSGELSITDGGNIELSIIGHFDDSIEGIRNSLRGNNSIARINGSVAKLGYVTLDYCKFRNYNFDFSAISKSLIYAKVAYIGVAYEDDEVITLNEFEFEVDGLNEWVGISGIKQVIEDGKLLPTIVYDQPKPIQHKLNNGMVLSIAFDATMSIPSARDHVSIRQKTYLSLRSDKEHPIIEFRDCASKIHSFLVFAMDRSISITVATGKNDSITREESDDRPVPISIYFASQNFTNHEPKISASNMLFNFHSIKDNAGHILNKWLECYDQFDVALHLFISTKFDAHKYLDTKFLALAQAIETYHRRTSKTTNMDSNAYEELASSILENCPAEYKEWLEGRLKHGNELHLRKRIKLILEPFKQYFGSKITRTGLISSIVNTRNYLTHYDDSLKNESATGTQLYLLYKKSDAIFQLAILKELNFSDAQIEELCKRSTSLKRKLQLE